MKLSSIYSNGMILQRDVDNTIRGIYEDGEMIEVSFDGKDLPVVFDESKMIFEAKVPAYIAGGPYTLTVRVNGGMAVEISDILFGDVYILGGQSNMELPLIWTTDHHYDEIRSADFAEIRQFEVPKIPLFKMKNEILEGGKWVNADQENIDMFSAIGFYFAKEKYLKDNVPVGLVQTAVGGAPVESLMSEENLRASFASFENELSDSGKCNQDKSKGCLWCYKEKLEKYDMAFVEETTASDMKRLDAWHKNVDDNDPGISGNWQETWPEGEYESFHMPSTFYQTEHENFKGSFWIQKIVDIPEDWCDKEVELRLGTLMDGDTTYVNGTFVGGFTFKYPPRRYFLKPGMLKPGKNTITVRMVVDTNIGGAVKECPYFLKNGDRQISLEGEWKMRFGSTSGPVEGQTFFLWSPTALFNSMIYPIQKYSCKAFLFYQGESNCEYPQYYAPLLKDMVKEWRSLFGKDVPFYMAELTYWLGDGPVYESDPFDGVRQVQKKVVDEIPYCYLIPTYDLGQYNDLHPQNKKDVALRFFESYMENEED